MRSMEMFDTIVVGGGAIGMSTARHLSREGVNVAVIEKESGPALHQSGRNSGVIHAGYNPKPGTLKAEYCIEGNRMLREYCGDQDVSVRDGGILIVARDDEEVAVINELERRGIANGTRMEMLAEDQIAQVEPHARGIAALRALDGASFDSRAYVQSLASETIQEGGVLLFDRRVASIDEDDNGVIVKTNKGSIRARVAINAAGLYADKLAGDLSKDMRIIPFRGYYGELTPQSTHLVNSHIYAAPDLNFPFLGVHLSKRADGRVIVGPGAMLAFGREAYDLISFRGGHLDDTLTWPGFYKMMMKPEFRRLIRQEVGKSLSTNAIANEAAQLVPELEGSDVVRSYAGNRAQMVDRDGNLVDDIVVRDTPRTIHVLNAVSPGLTCSLPFGRDLAKQALAKL
jgi:L-2-hydroxyglutarate oxidase